MSAMDGLRCEDDGLRQENNQFRLHHQLGEQFSKSELEDLAFVLGLDPENLRLDTKQQLALDLIRVCATSGLLPQLLAICREQRSHIAWPEPTAAQLQRFLKPAQRESAPPPFMAADLPPRLVTRPELFGQLHQKLLHRGVGGAPVAITTALQGAGGYGKTTLALALCHDTEIRRAFPDGILWVTLGERPSNLAGLVNDLILALTGQRPGYSDLNAAAAALAAALEDRVCLMVVDDVWQEEHLQPFLRGGVGCVRLVTSRNRGALPEVVESVDVDAMEPAQALRLLGAGLLDGDQTNSDLEALSERLGRWPLLLKLVNGALREQAAKPDQSLTDAIATVNGELTEFGITWFDAPDFDTADPSQRQKAVTATLGASLNRLQRDARFGPVLVDELAFYQSLVIFPEDARIPLATLAAFWGKTNQQPIATALRMCQRLCRRLWDVSLLQFYDADQTIRLHDIMHRYLVESLSLDLPNRQRRFIEAMRRGPWTELPLDEPYLWRNLAFHLHSAGQTVELRQILLNFDWLQNKLAVSDANALLADYDFLADDPDTRQVQRALRMSAHVLARDKSQLAGHLLGRLGQDESPAIASLLEQAGRPKPYLWLRPMSICLLPPDNPLLRTFPGHTGAIHALAVTWDGRYAISASEDTTLKVWDMAAEMELHTLAGHEGPVHDASITPDGRLAISASEDKTLKIWEISTGSLLRTVRLHSGPVTVVAAARDGRRVVSGDQGTLIVWALDSGEARVTIHSGTVRKLALHPDGRTVFGATIYDYLFAWDLDSGEQLRAIPHGQDSWPTVVAVSPDGRFLIGGADDGQLRLWVEDRGGIRLLGHTDKQVRAVAVTADSRRMVSAEADQQLKIWELATFQEELGSGPPEYRMLPSGGNITALAAMPQPSHLLSGSIDGRIQLWDLDVTGEWSGYRGGVTALAISPDKRVLVLGTSYGDLRLQDLAGGRTLKSVWAHKNAIDSVTITPGSRFALARSRTDEWRREGGWLMSWDLDNGNVGYLVRLGSLAALLPDGQRAIFRTRDGELQLWDLGESKQLQSLEQFPPDSIEPGRLAADIQGDSGAAAFFAGLAQALISAPVDPAAYNVTVENGSLVVAVPGAGQAVARFDGDGPIHRCTTTPDGRSIVAYSVLGQVYFLRLEEAQVTLG